MGRYFPLFVNLEGKEILIFGAGAIAARRIRGLIDFGAKLTVVAPKACAPIRELSGKGALTWRVGEYGPGMLKGAFLVLAATDQKDVNEAVWRECREAGIPVNVCSDREKCDFYFPGLAVAGDVVAGVTAGGENHRLAREVTERIRRVLSDSEDASERIPAAGTPKKN